MGKSIYDLREMLCEELEKITAQGSLSGEKLKAVDMLTHSIKSIDTIIAMEDSNEYSNRYSYADNRRDSYNSYVRRGRYARNDGLMHQLEDMMRESNDKDRETIKCFMEQMGM